MKREILRYARRGASIDRICAQVRGRRVEQRRREIRRYVELRIPYVIEQIALRALFDGSGAPLTMRMMGGDVVAGVSIRIDHPPTYRAPTIAGVEHAK